MKPLLLALAVRAGWRNWLMPERLIRKKARAVFMSGFSCSVIIVTHQTNKAAINNAVAKL